jgi:hypothetical protein
MKSVEMYIVVEDASVVIGVVFPASKEAIACAPANCPDG